MVEHFNNFESYQEKEPKLLTKGLIERFEKLGCQQYETDPVVVCKFFYPRGRATWYATEYNPEHQIFFGYGGFCPTRIFSQ